MQREFRAPLQRPGSRDLIDGRAKTCILFVKLRRHTTVLRPAGKQETAPLTDSSRACVTILPGSVNA